jgi:hypothetical protein
MAIIKNVYFCVVKTQVDNPDGHFWIILLGMDGLEKVFGKVRKMIGNDSHADQLQLTNQIDSAIQCVTCGEWAIASHGKLRVPSVKLCWNLRIHQLYLKT